MAEGDPVVTLEGVTVTYGSNRALREVTSSFAAGAFRLDTSTQRVHEIDGLRRLALARRLDRLAGLFLLSSSFKASS